MSEDGDINEPHPMASIVAGETSPVWDWTEALPDTEHVHFLKSINWSKTHVGPMIDWQGALRQATYQLSADSRPATLYWYGFQYSAVFLWTWCI